MHAEELALDERPEAILEQVQSFADSVSIGDRHGLALSAHAAALKLCRDKIVDGAGYGDSPAGVFGGWRRVRIGISASDSRLSEVTQFCCRNR